MRSRPIPALALLILTVVTYAASAQQPEDQRKPVEVKIHYRLDRWMMAPPVEDKTLSKNPGLTRSVFALVLRAVNPKTGQPFDMSEPSFECDPEDLRHMFRLEKKEFLLGEPILVEHRIELHGAGEWGWFVGGNYRARGRDDNFDLVLVRADGTVVPDVYPKLEGIFFGGGLGGNREITKDKPLSYWLGLQKYSAITEPGVYDLFCTTGYKIKRLGKIEALRAALPKDVALDHHIDDDGSLIDRTTGEKSKRYYLSADEDYEAGSSPLADVLPRIGEDPGVVGQFRITVRKGTQAEQRQMVEHWTKIAEPITTREVMGSYNNAVTDALSFAKQDYFLPLLERWVKTVKDTNEFDPWPYRLAGLALRPDKAAFSVLTMASPAAFVNAISNLPKERIADAIPLCISLLTHENSRVRAMAENHLGRWTGQSFERTWEGYHWERPTAAEGRTMQPLWRAWWAKNKRDFKSVHGTDN